MTENLLDIVRTPLNQPNVIETGVGYRTLRDALSPGEDNANLQAVRRYQADQGT